MRADKVRCAGVVLSVLLVLGCTTVGTSSRAGDRAAEAAKRKLSLERLYSLPSLIGTAPTGPSWSPDSTRLAFLWNDEGRNFRDVWLAEAGADGWAGAAPRRLTEFASEHGAGSARQAEGVVDMRPRLEREQAAEGHSGVRSVTWLADSRTLVAALGEDLWLVEPGERPLRLETGDGAEQSIRLAPGGRWLTYLRAGELFLREAAPEGTERQLTNVGAQAGVRVSSYRWAPNGAHIAVLTADTSGVPERSIPDYLTEEPTLRQLPRAYTGEPAPRHRVGVLEARRHRIGGEFRAPPIRWLDLPQEALAPSAADLGHGPVGVQKVAELAEQGQPGQILDYALSASGRYLAVDTSDLYAKDRRVFVVDLEGAIDQARLVWRDADAENETFYFWRISWSAAGPEPGDAKSDLLYVLSDRADDYHVYSVEPDGTEVRRLTTPDLAAGESWAVAEMHPVPDGLVVVANAPRPEERHLFLVGRGGAGPIQISERAGTHDPTLSPDGRWAAVLHSSDDSPPDLYLTEVRVHQSPQGERPLREARVTSSPLPEFEEYQWVTPRYVTFESHVDGAKLHGRLSLPPGFERTKQYPAILGSVYTDSVRNQWGGRTAHPTWGLDQYLLQQGYVLLAVDMRGSWGRGREFRRGIRLDYGGMDIEDLESGVRFLESEGYVDMERVGIWGSSYGGLMTAMSLFRKPGLYAAGIAGAPATNVWHALTGQMAVMMEPEDQRDNYVDSSPYLHAEGLEDPLMIIHGMRDWIVLYRDTLDLVHRLILLDKDVELVTLPDGGHGWDNEGLAQTRFAFRQMVRFFDQHLKPEGE